MYISCRIKAFLEVNKKIVHREMFMQISRFLQFSFSSDAFPRIIFLLQLLFLFNERISEAINVV